MYQIGLRASRSDYRGFRIGLSRRILSSFTHHISGVFLSLSSLMSLTSLASLLQQVQHGISLPLHIANDGDYWYNYTTKILSGKKREG